MSDLSDNAKQVAESRYFMNGEDWEGLSRRVGNFIASVEKDKGKWGEIFSEEIYNMNFIPGGRILRNSGRPKGGLLNCACLSVDDNIESIGETLKNSLISWKYGLGLGIDFSPLRYKGADLVSCGGKSSGLVSFLEAFDVVAKVIETGGSRRSGCAGICRVDHPDIFDFIDAKLKDGRLSYFNLSVAISDKFVNAVERDDDWDLTFSGVVVKTVKARKLWDRIISGMIKSGEPGLLNYSNLRKNNSYYFQPIEGVNLCSEIPLPAWGTCVLGSIVLPKFISGKSTNWKKLEHTISIAIRFLDNVIDVNYYPLRRYEMIGKDSRRIAMGVMGLHDYLMEKQIKYGSDRAIGEIDKLFKFIRDTAYKVSVDLAKEKGPFPKYSKVDYNSASFIRKLPVKLRRYIKNGGIRNVCLLACPPQGTTSLLVDVSSGIEPIFSLAYKREDRVSERYYIHRKMAEFLESNVNEKPEWLVDAFDLSPEDHLETQAVIQKNICQSVSKTINCPKNISSQELSDLLISYIYDLKGVTVYVDGSREKQVLKRLSIPQAKKALKESTSSFSTEDIQQCSTGLCQLPLHSK